MTPDGKSCSCALGRAHSTSDAPTILFVMLGPLALFRRSRSRASTAL